MKVGFYKNELIDIEADDIEEAAELYADEHQEIVEQSDLEFLVWVEDDGGKLFKVKMYTEFDPRYCVESVSDAE